MNTTPARQPQGQPTGGQFAAQSNPECDIDLNESTPRQRPADVPDGQAGEPMSIPQLMAERDRLQGQVDEITQKIIGAYAEQLQSHGQPSDYDQKWIDAGVTTPAERERLESRSVMPEHFHSEYRDTRMWACSERGDLIFEGELLSNGYQLHRYADGLDERRTFHHEQSVDIDGNSRAWNDLTGVEQMNYIKGYASAIGGDLRQEFAKGPETPAMRAGFRRGLRQGTTEAVIVNGGGSNWRSFVVVDSDAVDRHLKVTDVRPVPERGGYEAEVAFGQYRHYSQWDGVRTTVPWSEGSKVFFVSDAILTSEGFQG
jgi:hypothetical protein